MSAPELDPQGILNLLSSERYEEAFNIEMGGRLADLNRAFVRLSARYAAREDVKTALNKARSALMTEGDRGRGIRLFRMRRYEQAEASLRKAAAAGGHQDYHWLGRTLNEMGRRKDAIEQFRKAIAAGGDASDMLWLVSLLIDESQPEEALPWARKAVDSRGDPADQHWMGRVLTLCGKGKEALPYIESAVSRRGNPEDHYWHGRALAASGKLIEALPKMERAVKERGYGEHRFWLGRTLAELDRKEEALVHLRRAASLRGDADDFLWLGRILAETGRAAEAVPQLESALKKRAGAEEEYWLGTALSQLDRYGEALVHLNKAVSARGSASDHYYLGLALDKLGDSKGAATNFRKAVEKRGDAGDYHRLGMALHEGKQTVEALAMFRRALELKEDGDNHHWLGRSLLESGSADEALPHLLQSFRMRSAPVDLLLLKRALAANIEDGLRQLRAGWLAKADRLLSAAQRSAAGFRELEEESRRAMVGRIEALIRQQQVASRRRLSMSHFAEPLALMGEIGPTAAVLLHRSQIEILVGDYAAALKTAEESWYLAQAGEVQVDYALSDCGLQAARAARFAGRSGKALEILARIDHPGLHKSRRLPILIEKAAVLRSANPPDVRAAIVAAREARRVSDDDAAVRDRILAHLELGMCAAITGIAGESPAAYVMACRLAIDDETDERGFLLREVLSALESPAGSAEILNIWGPRLKLAQSGL